MCLCVCSAAEHLDCEKPEDETVPEGDFHCSSCEQHITQAVAEENLRQQEQREAQEKEDAERLRKGQKAKNLQLAVQNRLKPQQPAPHSSPSLQNQTQQPPPQQPMAPTQPKPFPAQPPTQPQHIDHATTKVMRCTDNPPIHQSIPMCSIMGGSNQSQTPKKGHAATSTAALASPETPDDLR